MAVPNRYDIVQAFAAKFGTPDPIDDTARAAWTDKVAQTLKAKYPSEGWGRKRNGPGRENNPDVVAIRSPFEGVDILPGSGGCGWSPVGVMQTPAEYVEVEAKDWLATVTPDPTPDPQPDPTPDHSADLQVIGRALTDILVQLKSLDRSYQAILATLVAYQPQVRPWPSYTGNVLWQTVVLKPDPEK